MLMQVTNANMDAVRECFAGHGLADHVHVLGSACEGESVDIDFNGETLLSSARVDLHRAWSETTWQMQSLRDNPECAQQEYDRLLDTEDSGLFSQLSFDPQEDICMPYVGGQKPRVAILREQGVNGQLEMAAAFTQAGFVAQDVTMTDIFSGRVSLEEFRIYGVSRQLCRTLAQAAVGRRGKCTPFPRKISF